MISLGEKHVSYSSFIDFVLIGYSCRLMFFKLGIKFCSFTYLYVTDQPHPTDVGPLTKEVAQTVHSS